MMAPMCRFVLVDFTSRTGKVKWLTDAPYDHSNLSWSPDGKRVAYERSRYEEPGSYMRSDLLVHRLEEGGEPEQLNTKGGSFTAPNWSPDGSSLSFIGHDFQHEGATLNKVWTVDLSSGAFRCLTEAYDLECTDVLISDMHWGGASPGAMWNSDGTGLYFQASERGNNGIYFIGVDRTIRQIAGG
ncbi:hypothetical protein ABFG93_14310 [Pseudalkalibacillus hwajinpoensis]|uniref:TolB family protein n=1 Tax=Guptibacillus hwajinpoensis TaxID=208199 RepID=UPI00325B8149